MAALGRGGNKLGEVVYWCVRSEILGLPQRCGTSSIREEGWCSPFFIFEEAAGNAISLLGCECLEWHAVSEHLFASEHLGAELWGAWVVPGLFGRLQVPAETQSCWGAGGLNWEWSGLGVSLQYRVLLLLSSGVFTAAPLHTEPLQSLFQGSWLCRAESCRFCTVPPWCFWAVLQFQWSQQIKLL